MHIPAVQACFMKCIILSHKDVDSILVAIVFGALTLFGMGFLNLSALRLVAVE